MHDLNDGVEVLLLVLVVAHGLHLLLKELSEVNSDGEVDEDILVEVEVVISFDGLDGLEFLEVTEGVSHLKQLLRLTSTLETLNHVDYVVDLEAVEHLCEEGIQGVNRVGNKVNNFLVEFFLHGTSESLDLEATGILSGEDVVAVVSVLKSEFKLVNIADSTERFVVLLSKHALAEGTHKGFRVGVINVV